MRLRMKAGIGTLAVTAVLAFSKCSGPLNDRLPEKAVAAEPANAPAETKAAQTQEKPKEEHAAKPKKEPCPKVVHEPDERCGIDRPYKKDKVPTMSKLEEYERARIRAKQRDVKFVALVPDIMNCDATSVKFYIDKIKIDCTQVEYDMASSLVVKTIVNYATILIESSTIDLTLWNTCKHIWKMDGTVLIGIDYGDFNGELETQPGPPFYGIKIGPLDSIHFFTNDGDVTTLSLTEKGLISKSYRKKE